MESRALPLAASQPTVPWGSPVCCPCAACISAPVHCWGCCVSRPHLVAFFWCWAIMNNAGISRVFDRSHKAVYFIQKRKLDKLNLLMCAYLCMKEILSLYCFFGCETYGILVSQPGIELRPLAVKARSPDYCTTRELPELKNFWKNTQDICNCSNQSIPFFFF